ncbi:MAG: hypothetical protein K0Q59_2508 [Paenibacillus sp.]|jgi:putative endonuclease|nr:hypothetical protein [Paenibacillus sp.]
MTSGKFAIDRRQLGRMGEQLAARYLQEQGYRIMERNWRCPKGELDMVAAYLETIVFVEVRSRRDTGTFGSAEESVDARKQRRVRELAHYYLYGQRALDQAIRFDVIAILFAADGTCLKLNHLASAF